MNKNDEKTNIVDGFIDLIWGNKELIGLIAAILGVLTFLGLGITDKNKGYKIHRQIINSPSQNISIVNNSTNSSINSNNINIVNSNINNQNLVNTNINNVNHNYVNSQNISLSDLAKSVGDLIGTFKDSSSKHTNTHIPKPQPIPLKPKIIVNKPINTYYAQQKTYPTGWYGFAFPSIYEKNFRRFNIPYTRLNTNKGYSFMDLCQSINKTCTTTIKGSNPTRSIDDGCYEKDVDYLAFCE